jgi:DNA-directed RNA polymerase subunit RPC12/RpoP
MEALKNKPLKEEIAIRCTADFKEMEFIEIMKYPEEDEGKLLYECKTCGQQVKMEFNDNDGDPIEFE